MQTLLRAQMKIVLHLQRNRFVLTVSFAVSSLLRKHD